MALLFTGLIDLSSVLRRNRVAVFCTKRVDIVWHATQSSDIAPMEYGTSGGEVALVVAQASQGVRQCGAGPPFAGPLQAIRRRPAVCRPICPCASS